MLITKRFQAALNAFRNPGSTKSFGNSGLIEDGYGQAGLSSRNSDITFTEAGAATAFAVVTEVQRGVLFIADSLRMLPGGIYDSRTKELLVSLDAPELNLYTPGATLIQAMRAYERQWLHNYIDSIAFSDWLYGETFTARLSNTEGGVTGVRWLNPLYTRPMTMRGRIDHYDYSGDDGYFKIPREDIAYRIHHRNPYNDLRGISPVLSALPSMNIGRDAERSIMSYFSNGMILGGVMMPESDTVNLHESQINRMKRDMQQKHQGVGNAWRWLLAPARMAFQMFDQPDMQKNYDVVERASKKVMMALGVPLELAGDPSGTKYENADKVMTNWLRVNGKAYANRVAGYITTNLLPYFDPGTSVYFGFDYTKIDQQDAALVQTDFDKGLVPYNVAQAQRGYEVDKDLEDIYNLNGKPVHKSVIIQVSRDPAAFSAVTPTPLMLQAPGQPALPAPPTIQALPEPAPEPQKGATSACIMLSLANNPDLIALQKRLKAMYPDPAVKWVDPADFHVTLVTVPAIDEMQIDELVEALSETLVDELSLKLGQLNCFDSVGEHALHFRIARNRALLDIQAGLHETCDAMGLQMSSYSQPERYTAHATMAYMPDNVGRMTFHGKISVRPTGVICSVERGGTYETVYPAAEDNTTQTAENEIDPPFKHAHGNHTHNWPIVSRAFSPSAALAELKAWYNFTARGKSKRPFVFDMLLGDPADEIGERLAAGEAPSSIVKALTPRFDGSQMKALETAFNGAVKALLSDDEPAFIKSVDSIRSEFSDRLTPVIESLRDGSLDNRRRAGSIIRQMVRSFGARAYRQGLADAGVDDTPDAEEQADIDRLLADSSTYISNFTDTLINGSGLTDGQAAGRADMWFNGSISPLYSAGLMAGNKNQMMEFGGEDGEETCEDCPRLKGQRHRAKDWKARNLDVPHIGQATACKGFKCFHKLFPVTGRAKGSW